jgi:putative flavoprotein involved in K+ transport
MTTPIETVVIGAGQAGLAVSYFLSKAGRAHVVLERAAAVANAWRNQRWDSFTLVTPNFQVRIPGANYHGPDPYGFMTRAQTVAYFDSYVRRFQLPVRCNVEVTSVEGDNEEYRVRTSAGDYRAQNVVVAIGQYQAPKLPSLSASLPADIQQLHSMEYRNPSSLPPGAVLIVGTGQSGAQIAQELYQSGRRVYLSVGSAGRAPRRYRGRDINDWLTRMGAFDTKLEELASPAARFAAHPQISGKNGGESLNLHQFARDGVRLLGHVRDARGGSLILAPDLYETLTRVDQFEVDTLKKIDDYIDRVGLNAPTQTIAQLQDGYQQPLIEELDLKANEIASVLWATGYTFDFRIVRLPVLDASGYPIHRRGVTRYEGLYFLGLPWLHTRGSGILYGVGEDAGFIAADIAGRAVGNAAAA